MPGDGFGRVVEAARAIRGYLPDLLDGPDAVSVDAALAAVLGSSSPDGVRILEVLRLRPATRDWLVAFLETGLPPDLAPPTEKAFAPLPGSGGHVDATRYRCPVADDYIWYRRSVGLPVPRCPTCHVPLVAR
jgi:hypothetical protein